MKGVKKLQVPTIAIKPKLFVIWLKDSEGVHHRFEKVDVSLDKAISRCWKAGEGVFKIRNYVAHSELSVDEINSLFRNFSP